jgi:hypothetical protein
MPRLAIIGVSFLLAVSAFAQNGPAISETDSSFRYQTKTANLSRVNFQEFALRIDGKTIKLHRGSYKRFAHGKGGAEVELFNQWILPSSQGSPDQVLLYFVQTLIGGSSSQTAYVQLLSIENAHLVLKQEFRFIPIDCSRACDFDSAICELRIIAKSGDLSPAFAPASADHVFYSFKGGLFIRTGWQTVSTKLP